MLLFFMKLTQNQVFQNKKIKEARIRWAFYQKLLKNTGGGW